MTATTDIAAADQAIQSLILVYNADWSLKGGLDFLGQMLRGGSDCALCDITHRVVTEKRDWKECKAELGLPVEALYRNQIGPELRDLLQGEYPAVIAKTAQGYVRLLGRAALQECGGEPAKLAEALKAEAARRHLSWSR